MAIYRPAISSDATAIVDFQLKMAWETEKLKLDHDTCALGVKAVFERPELGRYFVCEQEGELIGSLLITTEWSDWRNGAVWWIQSVYIREEFRGQGFFGQFYLFIKNLLQADPTARGLRLYVDKTNVVAQAVYGKMGMNADHYSLFEWMKGQRE